MNTLQILAQEEGIPYSVLTGWFVAYLSVFLLCSYSLLTENKKGATISALIAIVVPLGLLLLILSDGISLIGLFDLEAFILTLLPITVSILLLWRARRLNVTNNNSLPMVLQERYIRIEPTEELPTLLNFSPYKVVVVIEEKVTEDWQAKVSQWLVDVLLSDYSFGFLNLELLQYLSITSLASLLL